MSQSGRGKQNRIPQMRGSNGASDPIIPDDLVWDAENPPHIFSCSQDVNHHPQCNGSCEEVQLDSELQVDLLNIARAFARLGMSFLGVPVSIQNAIPVPGVSVELLDLLCWNEAIKEILQEQFGVEEFEFQERFRKVKYSILKSVYDQHARQIKEQRTRDMLGINKPPLLGPNGQPLQ